MLKCTKCDETNPAHFHKNASSKTGYAPYCKACMTPYRLRSYVKHHEERTARMREYYQAHREKMIETTRRWRARRLEMAVLEQESE